MSKQHTVSNFFIGLRGVLGYLGTGWYPNSARDGVAPFRMVSSDAGETISGGSALQLSAVWGCVRLLAETVASLPLELKMPGPDGKLVNATNSTLWRLLARRPNKDMTAVEFWEMVMASLGLWGNFYAEKITVANRVVALNPFRPEYMTVYRDKNHDMMYAYKRGDQEQTYKADDILHIKGFGVDGLIGLSPVAMARQSIGRSIATDKASGGLFANGLFPSGFLEFDGSFKTSKERDDVRDRLTSFTGASNAGKVMVLENGMKYSGITMNPVDAQLLESRYFNIEEICRWYRVPPQLIGHTDKASSWASSLENVILWFVKSAMTPYLTRIEQAVTRALNLPAAAQLRFNFDALLRGDSAARAALYASGAQNGWMGRDEIREREGMQEREGTDVMTVQSNLIPIDKLGELGGQPPPAAQEPMK